MVRRGWRSADRRLGSGHSRAASAVSPVATCFVAVSSRSSVEFSTFSAQAEPVPKTSGTHPFGDPQVRVTAAQERVAKLEAALAALHGVDGPRSRESASCFEACEGGESAACGHPDQSEGFLSRARAHMAELDAKRTTVSANIQDAEKRLEALKEVQKFARLDAETELRQLREKVAQLQGSWKVPSQRWRRDQLPSALAGEKISFPMEELQEWIGGRQADLHEAMLSGRPDEVARISNIMAMQHNSGNEKSQLG